MTSLLTRLAFDPVGRPRGWFRLLAFSGGARGVRAPFRRFLYRKNGSFHPEIQRFIERNAEIYAPLLDTRPALERAWRLAEARRLFGEQQGEIDAAEAAAMIDGMTERPLISVLMPVYRTPVRWLRRAIESLQAQHYGNWELCAVDDHSPADDQRRLIAEMAATDPRIRLAVHVTNGGISAASNTALAMARGAFIALLDHDDEITPDALLRMVEAINRVPEADFLYSDECKIDEEDGRLFDFMLKPGWSPEIMHNFMLTSHLTVYRTSVVQAVGGFRGAYDFAQDYDLALRVAEVARRVVHVERILYLWRAIAGSAAKGGKDFAREANLAALNDAFARRGIPATAEARREGNRAVFATAAPPPKVSVVVVAGNEGAMTRALGAIRTKTDYPDYEVIVVADGAEAWRPRAAQEGGPAFRLVEAGGGLAACRNAGAEAATGSILLFLADDLMPLGPDWIARLSDYLRVHGVGAVTPKILAADGRIAAAGMILGGPDLAFGAYAGVPADGVDDFLTLHRVVRNVSVPSGDCLAIRRDLFLSLGGFDAVRLPDRFAEIDLGFRLLENGLRLVYTPHAVLGHLLPAAGKAPGQAERAWLLGHRGDGFASDPMFTPTMQRVLGPGPGSIPD